MSVDRAFAVSHNGERLVTGGAAGQVLVWSLKDGAEKVISFPLIGHEDTFCQQLGIPAIIMWSLPHLTES